jgi:hypothetical protein
VPDLAASLAGGGRVLDVHCGGGKGLIAIATRFPETSLGLPDVEHGPGQRIGLELDADQDAGVPIPAATNRFANPACTSPQARRSSLPSAPEGRSRGPSSGRLRAR